MIFTAILHNPLLKYTHKTLNLISKNPMNKSCFLLHSLLRSLEKYYLTITTVNRQLKKTNLNRLFATMHHPIGTNTNNLFDLNSIYFLFFLELSCSNIYNLILVTFFLLDFLCLNIFRFISQSQTMNSF